jgi:hypothetical protein
MTENSIPTFAKLVNFRYSKGFAVATLDNGVSGILGDAGAFPFNVLLHCKGLPVFYEESGTWTNKEGAVAPKYKLSLQCIDEGAL